MSLNLLVDAPLSIFSRASEAAERVSRLAWFLIGFAAVVYVVVIAVMLIAMRRNRHRDPASVDLSDPGVKWVVIGGGLIPGLVLLAVFVVAESALGRTARNDPAVTIHVIGHQWWWEVEYVFPDVSRRFRTANEIHVPVGREARLLLTTADVIHSFWVPQLQGKLDLIPGDTNDLRILPREAGRYEGTCAEFCGTQHAHMRFTVVAEDSASFVRWLGAQLEAGRTPTDSVTLAGQQLFVGGPCALCHTVRGTPALATTGPDLTHVGSRGMLGAGTVANSLGNLEAWIVNAPSLKPGTQMPAVTAFRGAELRALAEYVASLK